MTTPSAHDTPSRSALPAADHSAESIYRAAFEISEVPIMVVESDMTISLVNSAFETASGYAKKEIEGRLQWTVFIPEQERPRLERDHRLRRIDPAAAPRSFESRFRRRDGSIHEMTIYASIIPQTLQCVVALHDMTRQRHMEEELQKAQKLESLAQMASGIAHDFNNALTIILSSVSLARQYAGTVPDAVAKLREAEKEILRAKGLTSQLLTFSRGGEPALKTMPVGELVRDTARFALLGSPVQLELRISDDTWPSRIDSAQMAQVISSIALNARQAMPDGGTVVISMQNIRLEHRLTPHLPSGLYVLIAISDTGSGITAEHLPRVFDPFFTTKKGCSGLGLSSSYTIMRKHHGHIALVSEPGVGTTVYLYLPAALETEDDELSEGPASVSSRKRILLVEEHDESREKIAAILQEYGYDTTAMESGSLAVKQYRSALTTRARFDVVILDLSPIGREGARGCLKSLLELDPQACVIGGSRYAEAFDLAEYRAYGFAHVAQKPYNIDHLISLLKQVTKGTQ